MYRKSIHTDEAPAAIGPYSQAISTGETIYLSGQIPIDPSTGQLISEDFEVQAHQVLANLAAVAKAAGGSLADIVKLTVFLDDLGNFQILNGTFANHFDAPFPARSTIQVAALPLNAKVEIDAILVLPT